uniref:Uncharacterized protein n=1 Tax=Populus trichocarpa TaxID=3694 RepID=A0A2K2A3S4_POPTR
MENQFEGNFLVGMEKCKQNTCKTSKILMVYFLSFAAFPRIVKLQGYFSGWNRNSENLHPCLSCKKKANTCQCPIII